MELAEAIDRELERLYRSLTESGEIGLDEYCYLVEPLHKALLALAQKERSGELPDLS